MVNVEEVMIYDGGLFGDRSRAGKRAVTLIQQEHLAAIGSYLGREAVAPEVLRRNLVVSGINLAALKGREVQVGEAILRFTVICAPCSRMEEALGKGGYSAVRGHGGWCAEVVQPGQVKLGDPVQPVD
ncbi:MOSC domain-containing protein [Ruegeria sp. R14_0]|uniref:MOSC domain-containing protein n=1 Tax=Ruegeria sp. R14_0 TaxID=2821100 RepID=UPI001ADC481E|nr:MOSC domain-containing protein [Ruegeria sp. R14_0]MBO9445519.1 MOSC domain-containing protein [Ruegeria sp. R14_0]